MSCRCSRRHGLRGGSARPRTQRRCFERRPWCDLVGSSRGVSSLPRRVFPAPFICRHIHPYQYVFEDHGRTTGVRFTILSRPCVPDIGNYSCDNSNTIAQLERKLQSDLNDKRRPSKSDRYDYYGIFLVPSKAALFCTETKRRER